MDIEIFQPSDLRFFLEAEAKKKKLRKGSKRWCRKHRNSPKCDDGGGGNNGGGGGGGGGSTSLWNPPPHPGNMVRKNILDLTTDEREQFFNGLLRLEREGIIEALVRFHWDFSGILHRNPYFFFIHRLILWILECHLGSPVHYWKTEEEVQRFGSFAASSVWTDAFFGPLGRPEDNYVIQSGRFAIWRPLVPNGTTGLLVRSSVGIQRRGSSSDAGLPTNASVQQLIETNPNYATPPYDQTSEGSFCNTGEGWRPGNVFHNRPHTWVDLLFATFASNGDAALFYTHHSNCERWFVLQQLMHGINYASKPGQGFDDPWPFPYGGTPRNWSDHTTLGYTYV